MTELYACKNSVILSFQNHVNFNRFRFVLSFEILCLLPNSVVGHRTISFFIVCFIFYFRYELREDKEREARRTSDYFDSLRGDIRMDLQKLSPIPQHRSEFTRSDKPSFDKQTSPHIGHRGIGNLDRSNALQNVQFQQLRVDGLSKLQDWETCSSERLTTVTERDHIKQEMMSLLRETLQDMQVERTLHSVPLNGTDLYQTHLYTQL